jgi:hypothetical protein
MRRNRAIGTAVAFGSRAALGCAGRFSVSPWARKTAPIPKAERILLSGSAANRQVIGPFASSSTTGILHFADHNLVVSNVFLPPVSRAIRDHGQDNSSFR